MSSSVSSSAAPKSRSSRNRAPRLRKWVIVVGAILSSLLLFVIVRMQGHVSGQEFSPTHFQVRNFSFYEIPLLHVQITPIKRKGVTPATATYVRQKSLITKPTGVPTVWHLVHISRGLTGTTPGDASLLIDHLTLNLSGKDFWRQWCVDQPQRAAILWPLVQRLAERELYVLIPRLMEMAQTDQPAAEFASQADTWLKKEYASLVTDMREAERQELADLLLEEALTDFPGDTVLTKLKQGQPSKPSQPETGASASAPSENS